MCKLMKGTLEMGSLLSSGFFQLISVERYFYIVPTFGFGKVKGFCQRYKHVMLLANVTLVAVTVAPFLRGLDVDPASHRCANFTGKSRWMSTPYSWLTFLVYSVHPAIVTTLLSRNLRAHFANDKTCTEAVNRSDMNKRVISNMLLVLTLFILCTLPVRLLTILVDMVQFKSRSLLLSLQLIAYILYSLQGTLNPILYSMLAREWRKNLYALVRSVFLKSKAGSGHTIVTSVHVH